MHSLKTSCGYPSLFLTHSSPFLLFLWGPIYFSHSGNPGSLIPPIVSHYIWLALGNLSIPLALLINSFIAATPTHCPVPQHHNGLFLAHNFLPTQRLFIFPRPHVVVCVVLCFLLLVCSYYFYAVVLHICQLLKTCSVFF